MAQRKAAPLVGVVMGSDSDWDIMQHAAAQLDAFGVAYEARVLSAHRMPDDMFEYAEDAGPRGLRAIIAGAGGAAHLPGMLAVEDDRAGAGRAGAVEIPARRGFAAIRSCRCRRAFRWRRSRSAKPGAANAGLFAVALLAATDPGARAQARRVPR